MIEKMIDKQCEFSDPLLHLDPIGTEKTHLEYPVVPVIHT